MDNAMKLKLGDFAKIYRERILPKKIQNGKTISRVIGHGLKPPKT